MDSGLISVGEEGLKAEPIENLAGFGQVKQSKP